jgi:hypothetical protein
MLTFGIILSVVAAISILIVSVMFWCAATEDGRDQRRRNAARPEL